MYMWRVYYAQLLVAICSIIGKVRLFTYQKKLGAAGVGAAGVGAAGVGAAGVGAAGVGAAGVGAAGVGAAGVGAAGVGAEVMAKWKWLA